MNVSLQNRVELFADNARAVRKHHPWSFAQASRLAALLYALEDRPVDLLALRSSYDLIKREARAFSPFRGSLRVSIASLLSLSPEPDRTFQAAQDAYARLKQLGFHATDYLAVAAQQIAAHAQPGETDSAAVRTRAFYEGLKRNHWFLTGYDDYIFCAMLGLSDIDPDAGVARMEALYAALKPEFKWSNAVQTLSEVLVLGGETGQTAARLVELRDRLRDRGMRMDRAATLPSLGVLALLPVDPVLVVEDLMDVFDLLRAQKGFGGWSVMKRELLLLATALVASEQVDVARRGAFPALATSLANIILAQEAAIAATAASAAAAAAAASSS